MPSRARGSASFAVGAQGVGKRSAARTAGVPALNPLASRPAAGPLTAAPHSRGERGRGGVFGAGPPDGRRRRRPGQPEAGGAVVVARVPVVPRPRRRRWPPVAGFSWKKEPGEVPLATKKSCFALLGSPLPVFIGIFPTSTAGVAGGMAGWRRFNPKRRSERNKVLSRLPQALLLILSSLFLLVAVIGTSRPKRNEVHVALPSAPPMASPSLVEAIFAAEYILLLWLVWPFVQIAVFLYDNWRLPDNWRSKIPVWARAPFCESSRHTLYQEFTRQVFLLIKLPVLETHLRYVL